MVCASEYFILVSNEQGHWASLNRMPEFEIMIQLTGRIVEYDDKACDGDGTGITIGKRLFDM